MQRLNRKDLRVVAAAVLRDDLIYTMPPPARHHDIVHAMAKNGLAQRGSDEQGFLLNDGHFCMRKAARIVAEDAGQLIRTPEHKELLFSEDVW
jgi:hypothetical protein